MDNRRSALALNGGSKIRVEPMPKRKAFGEAEIAALNEAVQYYNSLDIDPPYQGKYEREFCDEYVKFMGGGYADAVATGTGSVFVALEALAPPKGSEIIISPFCDAGPFNCILYLGCIPVVADAEPFSYNAGVEQFLEKVTDKTSVVLAVHSTGHPLRIDEIVNAMHERNIKVLEDCSQAPGAVHGEKRVGTFGDIAATSTMFSKTLASGACGGLVYTRDEELYHRALACADRGKQLWRSDYEVRTISSHLFPALNWNTDELSCAIGLASIRRLDRAIAKRMDFVRELSGELERRSATCRAYDLPSGASPFFLPIWVDEKQLNCDKIAFAQAVRAEGIDLNPHYDFLIQDWPWAQKYSPANTPNAAETKNRSFNLFLNERYGEREVADVVGAILKVEAAFASH